MELSTAEPVPDVAHNDVPVPANEAHVARVVEDEGYVDDGPLKANVLGVLKAGTVKA